MIVFRLSATLHPALGALGPACQGLGGRGAAARMVGIHFDAQQISRQFRRLAGDTQAAEVFFDSRGREALAGFDQEFFQRRASLRAGAGP